MNHIEDFYIDHDGELKHVRNAKDFFAELEFMIMFCKKKTFEARIKISDAKPVEDS